MQCNNQYQQLKKTQAYYPSFILEQNTNKNIEAQKSIVNKILRNSCKKYKIPGDIVYKISSYVFPNPVCLNDQVYRQISNSQIGYGNFLLSKNKTDEFFKIQVKKIWKKLDRNQMSHDNIMRFAVDFDYCMQFKQNFINLICEQGEQSSQKLKIVSENNRYFHSLLKVINKYKKDRIINEYVVKAFGELMSRYIAQVVLNNYQQFLVINSLKTEDQVGNSQHFHINNATKIVFFNYLKNQNTDIGLTFSQNKLRIINDQYVVYALTQRITERGKMTLLAPNNYKDILLDDIFLRR